ncbi:uncharacterized protein LOC115414149 [Sphaeramia orbicularis]|uniref:uncharacterized protein LOC115414149 n=1 Tax=Sphaeramia orbicularis TaxID=375764 RepID=UPI00117D25D4|nr:uncharacterized protein LOC115414149 [Sphaeramia orbicularis]
MHVLRTWRVLCVLGYVGASLSVNDVEYDGNCADDFDNEISQDQQEGPPAAPCQADSSRWDKLFIALEDSHMRQNMLLRSLEQCCGGMTSLKLQVDKLAKGTCHQLLPSVENACRAQAEQAHLKLRQDLAELREKGVERERRLNVTLQKLLHNSHEQNSRLRRLEENKAALMGPADTNRRGPPPTLRPGGSGPLILSVLKEQEVSPPANKTVVEKALVAIATELQKVHLQLNRLMEQTVKDRGDT